MKKSFKENERPFKAYLDHLKQDSLKFANAHLFGTRQAQSMVNAYLDVLSGGVAAYPED